MEGDDGTVILRFSRYLHRRNGLALGVLLHPDFALAVDFGHQKVAEGIHAGNTHTVQTAGNLIAVLVELTAGVQHRKHHFQGAAMLFLVHARGDTAAVVLHPDGIVFQDFNIYVCAEAGHSLVDTVIHHLIYQMVQTPFADVADIHGGALAHRLKAFQNLDTIG